jgi:hypothetical protein
VTCFPRGKLAHEARQSQQAKPACFPCGEFTGSSREMAAIGLAPAFLWEGPQDNQRLIDTFRAPSESLLRAVASQRRNLNRKAEPSRSIPSSTSCDPSTTSSIRPSGVVTAFSFSKGPAKWADLAPEQSAGTGPRFWLPGRNYGFPEAGCFAA